MSIYKFPRNHTNKAPQKENFMQTIPWSKIDKRLKEKEKGANLTANQPRSQGSLLLVPTERRRLGKKPGNEVDCERGRTRRTR